MEGSRRALGGSRRPIPHQGGGNPFFGGLLGPSWPSWRPLEPVLGPSWRPKSDLKSLPKSIILWITVLINFSIDFGSIFDRFWTRFGVARGPFCIVNNGIWSTWADFKLIWDWIPIWTRFWTSFGGQVGSEKGAKTSQDRPRQAKTGQDKSS